MLLLGFWVLGIALIVFQTTVVPDLPLWMQQPDFIFIFCAYIAYRFPWFPALFLVFNFGWIMDVVAGVLPGYFSVSLLASLLVLKILTYKSPFREATSLIPYVGLSYFLVGLLLEFVYSVVLPEKVFNWSWNTATLRAVLIMVTTIVLFPLINRFYEFILKYRLRKKPFRARRHTLQKH